MKKLTSDTASALLARLKENASYVQPTIHEGYMMQALEIAMPVLEQQEKGEGDWLHWGGEMALPPVGNDVIVEVKTRSGVRTQGEAKCFRWRNFGQSYSDIIAYRVIEQQERERGEEA